MKNLTPATIICRVEFKSNSKHVVYIVRSSDGTSQYEVAMFNGKACSCSCPSRKPCRHMKAAEAREAERQPVAAAPVSSSVAILVPEGISVIDRSEVTERDILAETAAIQAVKQAAAVPAKYAAAHDYRERSSLATGAFSILR
jgi:SWIM zinc finger